MLWYCVYFPGKKVCGSDWKKRKIWTSERLDFVFSSYGSGNDIRVLYHSMVHRDNLEMVCVNQDLVVDIK